MTKKLPTTLLVVWSLAATSAAYGQEERLEIEQLRLDLPESRAEWQLLEENIPTEDLKGLLFPYGFEGRVSDLNDKLGSSEVSAYFRSLGPGVTEVLIVPQNGYSPIQLSPRPPNSEYKISQMSWSREDIRIELLEGIQAAIDALCDMRARPSEIRVRASAFGVAEMEALWDANEVCAR